MTQRTEFTKTATYTFTPETSAITVYLEDRQGPFIRIEDINEPNPITMTETEMEIMYDVLADILGKRQG